MTLPDMTGFVNVHDPAACEGRGCSVHHPSDHLMRDWPIVWRNDRGFFERVCEHSIGHPDPDDMAYLASEQHKQDDIYGDLIEWASMHGCDGCCRRWRKRTADKYAEMEYTQARTAYAALTATIGTPKNAEQRRRLVAAEARLQAVQEARDAARSDDDD